MKKQLYVSVLIGIAFLCNTWSQNIARKFDFVNIKEGISKVGIYTIQQDNSGFIWLGTNGAGLYRYDGLEYKSYRYINNDSISLSSNIVLSALVDNAGHLWVGTENGLNLYDKANDKFRRIPNTVFSEEENVNIAISALFEDNHGNLFIGTLDLGLFKMDLKSFKVESIISKESLESQPLDINAIEADNFNRVIVASDHGMKTYDYKTNTLKFLIKDEVDINESEFESLVIDKDNTIWGGTRANGLYRISGITKDIELNKVNIEDFKFSTNKFLSLLDLKDGTLLCGTENNGMFHINDKGEIIDVYNADAIRKHNILSNSIWSLFLDRNDRIWVGYYNKGVSIYDKLFDKFDEIESYNQDPNTLRHESVTAIVEDNTNKLWISTDGGGIDVYDPKANSIFHINPLDDSVYRGLTSDYIEALHIDKSENLWAGSWDNGLFLLKKGSKRFENFNPQSTNNGLATKSILSIAEDNDGSTIWLGTYTDGLYSYDPITNTFKHYNQGPFLAHRISDVEVRKVLIDDKNNIWLATEVGLFKIERDAENFNLIAMQERMPKAFNEHNSSIHIISLFQSSDSTIWIGSKGGGMCSYNPYDDTFKWYNTESGLIQENVNGIIEGYNGELWLSGNLGITKFNVDTNTFTNYNVNDGLLSNDYNFNSTFKDSKGILYFGNFKGVDYFDPQAIRVNENLPSLYLTDFKLFNESVVPGFDESPLSKVISKTDSLTLNSTQSVFTIEYSSVNFTRPEKNSYAYYLDGYESGWNYVGGKRSATYTNLDAGNYTFKLKAANNDGIWNENPLEVNITILSPWWKTSWAIFSYVLLFLLGVYLLNRITKSRLRDRQLVENERNNRLLEKELNEKKLQFFTNISHEFRTPLSLIISPLEDIIKNESENLPEHIKRKHYTIHKNTSRLYRLINELLDFRKLELDKIKIKARELDLVAFTHNVISHFKEEAFIKNIHLSIDADMQQIPIWADESMLEKIIFNILSNAFKVTPEDGAISVELYTREDLISLPLANQDEKVEAIEITISDTGPGLSKSQVKKIFKRFYRVDNLNKTYYGGTGIGLEVVKNFVTLHKGKIKVKSEEGKGTTFKITLPAGKKHFTESEQFTEKVDELVSKSDFIPVQKSDVKEVNIHEEDKSNLKTLLIVEDNTELRNYLNSELKSQYKVLLCKNGKEGLQLAKKHLPDIIMTDVIMPEMDGFAFCKHIKSDIKTSHIPLLMLTAKTTIENRVEGIENGADAYMIKPFDMGLLKLRLSQLITSRQLIFNKYFNVISDVDMTNTTSMDKDFIEKVLNYINESIGDPDLNVESLASKLNLSRSQFYRKIKALTNQTANEFIRNIRLLKAKQMIESGNNNISEVCYKVGFSSPSYFTKCFKSYFGVLPKEVESH